ncbi:hypothetical protein [Streptomyces sp. NBC_00557]|uniref:hypothetical protein n=1 Tax=Streptomyces sp. NBC_00557 TaxID=2975776 RepID=UPI002E819C19|nr:hypothetical protein [Streptomyces sp. NBC_00557]WUC39653.1 hypothetical protein OG956_38495 [Streptomyces sp. NBC_00557]
MSGDTGNNRTGARRPRVLSRPRVGWPPALRELKDLLYEAYLEAGAPSLDTIAAGIAADDDLAGAPGRDTVHRVISDPVLPPRQADAVAVARVLARTAAWDEADLAGRVRTLWVRARLATGAGRPIGDFRGDDRLVLHDLEVHPALDTGGADRFGALPAYIPRAHDAQLAGVVAAAQMGSSGIAVLVGGSSTGKTRALWEAVRNLPDGWRLWHPLSPTRPDAVLVGVEDVAPRTVVWLNEAQFYLTPDPLGEQVAANLRSLLHDPSRGPVLVLATLWPDHWDTLTTRTTPDRHAQARELLDGRKIKVPDAFTSADLAALTGAGSVDPRLLEAAERARDAQVTQYLAGVPVLLERYEGASCAARALIDVAMDARRLGAGPRIPLAWLADAAPDYLTDTEWDATGDDWLEQALAYVSTPCRGIPGILTPVKPDTRRNQRNRRATPDPGTGNPPGQGRLYLLADYLDQHGRRAHAGRIPPIDFWTAAAHHAHPTDLNTLGDAAWDRGLYRDAAQLHKNATAHRNPHAPATLVRHFRQLHPTDLRPTAWAAAHASLDDPYTVARLLDALREAGAQEQVTALLARDPAAHASLDDPYTVAELLDALREAGAQEQVTALLARDPAAHASLDEPSKVSMLLDALREAGAQEQLTALAVRAASHTALDDPYTVAELLDTLRWPEGQEQLTALLARDPAAHVSLDDPGSLAVLLDRLQWAGAQEQLTALAVRAAAHAPLDDPYTVAVLLDGLQWAGAREQLTALLAGDPAAHVSLDDPGSVAVLLESLGAAEAREQLMALAVRAAAHAPLDDPGAVADLLDVLRGVGAREQATALLARDPAAHASLDDPRTVAKLLHSLREAGAREQLTALLARDPAAHTTLDNPRTVPWLLDSLREAEAQEQVTALAAQLPAVGRFDRFLEFGDNRKRFRLGREPNGKAAPSWTWNDLE